MEMRRNGRMIMWVEEEEWLKEEKRKEDEMQSARNEREDSLSVAEIEVEERSDKKHKPLPPDALTCIWNH